MPTQTWLLREASVKELVVLLRPPTGVGRMTSSAEPLTPLTGLCLMIAMAAAAAVALAHRLVDRSGLPAGEMNWTPVGVASRSAGSDSGRGLSRQSRRRRDHRSPRSPRRCGPVAGEHLVEDLATLIGSQSVYWSRPAPLERAVGVERVQHRVVALPEQMGVGVGDATVQPKATGCLLHFRSPSAATSPVPISLPTRTLSNET